MSIFKLSDTKNLQQKTNFDHSKLETHVVNLESVSAKNSTKKGETKAKAKTETGSKKVRASTFTFHIS